MKSNTDYAASPQGIFGVPLQISIRYANVAISLFNDEGQSYIYGYVPIVVAKCGVFLKEKGELVHLLAYRLKTNLIRQRLMSRAYSGWPEVRSASRS